MILPGILPSSKKPYIQTRFVVAKLGMSSRLMSGSFQPMFGKLYTLFPAKILILASLATFIAGTLLCALAPSSPVFILGRAITGFATAAVISGAFALVPPVSVSMKTRSTNSKTKHGHSHHAATEAIDVCRNRRRNRGCGVPHGSSLGRSSD